MLKDIIEEKEIKHLCHFTQAENIYNILYYGLLPRKILNNKFIDFKFNDNARADLCENAICLSISFPNYRMFYKLRKNNKDINWIILLLDPKILYDLDCAFCNENAASNNVTDIPIEDRRTEKAFKCLFEDFKDVDKHITKRTDLKIPDNYPTNPQAEVLVFDNIPVNYIKCIAFSDKCTKEKYDDISFKEIHVIENLFSWRKDYENWRNHGN